MGAGANERADVIRARTSWSALVDSLSNRIRLWSRIASIARALWRGAAMACLALVHCWKTMLAMAAVSATGVGLQVAAENFLPKELDLRILAASLVWQALMATAMAMLVSSVHRFIIDRHPNYMVPAAFDGKHAPLALARKAGLYALAIWVAIYALTVALRIVVNAWPLPGLRFVDKALVFGLFVFGALLNLVRPALALGARRPLREAAGMAWRDPFGLLVIAFLLQQPLAYLTPMFVLLPRDPDFLGPTVKAQIATIALITIATLFQFILTEATMVVFAMRSAGREAGREQEKRDREFDEARPTVGQTQVAIPVPPAEAPRLGR